MSSPRGGALALLLDLWARGAVIELGEGGAVVAVAPPTARAALARLGEEPFAGELGAELAGWLSALAEGEERLAEGLTVRARRLPQRAALAPSPFRRTHPPELWGTLAERRRARRLPNRWCAFIDEHHEERFSPGGASATWLDRSPPLDPLALAEWQGLSPAERESFAGVRAVLAEGGEERGRAERDAVAACLQARRLRAQPSRAFSAWLAEGSPVESEERERAR